MSGELHPMETRRRSRSKTPFIAIDEGPAAKRKTTSTPTVQTIIEETVEVTSSSSLAGGQNTKKVTSKLIQQEQQHKIKTSDYSSEDASPDIRSKAAEEQKKSSNSTTTTTSSSTVVTTKTRKGGSNKSVMSSTSTPKANFVDSYAAQFATSTGNRQKEISQNELNTAKEKSNGSFMRFFSNSFNSSSGATTLAADQSANGEVSDHIAYLEYKRAGEYWKTTPKTDYTYSELSPHRRELAPGVVAMPNMSRPSLENHHERVAYMIQRDPTQEDFIRRRYEATRYAEQRRATERFAYDSGDEVDVTQFNTRSRKTTTHYKEESWFRRIITIITTIWTSVVGVDESASKSQMYYTHVGTAERGFFGKIADSIFRSIVTTYRAFYVAVASILYLDTWLLQSSNPNNQNKKRFLLVLLMLLPLLLLTGVYYYLHPNEPFPPNVTLQELNFALPELPKVSDYINQENYEQLKLDTLQRIEYLRDWTDDYVLYLRTISQNLYEHGRKFFQREEYFERV